MSTSGSGSSPGNTQCLLLEAGFADLVQASLGCVAVLLLAYKRLREKPRRPWKLWFLDVSKQALGAAAAHGLNILLARFLSNVDTREQDRCAWYFVNYTLDTSVGVFIAWIMIHAVEELARQCHWKRLEKNGEYYGAPHVFLTWLLQFCVWLLIIAMAKACLLGLLVLAIHPLADFALWASSPFKDHPHTELVVVMVVCPFLMNATQFWIQDNFLKGRTVKMSHDADDDESSGGGGGGGGSRPDDQDDVEGKLVRNPALSGGAAGPLLVHADGTDAVRDYSGRFDGIVTSDHTEDDAKLAAHATTATGTSGSGRQSSGSGPLSSHSSGGSGGASGGSGHPLELGGHAEWEREGSTLSAMEVSSRHSDDFTGGGEFDSMLSTSARASSTSRLPPSVN